MFSTDSFVGPLTNSLMIVLYIKKKYEEYRIFFCNKDYIAENLSLKMALFLISVRMRASFYKQVVKNI